MGGIVMRIWYDTEFHERGPSHPVEAISIGMVREDGKELYCVLNDWDVNAALGNEFLVEHVLPHLPGRREWLSRAVVASKVTAFVRGAAVQDYPRLPQLWAWYSAYDHVVLSQLYGTFRNMPNVPWFPFYSHDLRVEVERLGIRWGDLPPQPENQHDALADAKWNRELHAVIDRASS